MPDCGVHYLRFALACLLMRSPPPALSQEANTRAYTRKYQPVHPMAPPNGPIRERDPRVRT